MATTCRWSSSKSKRDRKKKPYRPASPLWPRMKGPPRCAPADSTKGLGNSSFLDSISIETFANHDEWLHPIAPMRNPMVGRGWFGAQPITVRFEAPGARAKLRRSALDDRQQHFDVAAAVRQVGARAVRALPVHCLFQRA